jgi:tetratricopeptide (TPR) repeat protein
MICIAKGEKEMSKALRYTMVTAIVAGIVVFVATGLFAVGSGASGGGSSFTRDPEKEARIAYEKGQAYVEQKEYSKAANSFKRAISYKSDFAEAYNMLGFSLRKDGKYKAAIKQYEKALSINPDFAEAHEYIGEAYLGIGDRDSAWKHYTVLVGLGREEAGELLEKIEAYDSSVAKK